MITTKEITAKELLVYLTIKYKGKWDDIFYHINTKQPLDREDMAKTLENVDLSNFITMTDDDYPESLKKLEKPPFAIEKREWNGMEREKYIEKYSRKIASWLYAEAVEHTHEGDWITYFDEIDESFSLKKSIEQDKELQQAILNELKKYEGIAFDDYTLQGDCFDINLYTDYARKECWEE